MKQPRVTCPQCGLSFVGIANTPERCPQCGHNFLDEWLPGARDPNHPERWTDLPPRSPAGPFPPPAPDPDPALRRWPTWLIAGVAMAGGGTGGFLAGYILGVGQARAAVQALLRQPAYQGASAPLPSLLGGLTGWWFLTLLILAGMVWARYRGPARVRFAATVFLRAARLAAVWVAMFHVGAALAA